MNRRDFLWLSAVLLSGCGGRKYIRLPAGSIVLALGDSLTAGVGAPRHADYPSRLAEMTGLQVINGGVSGNTSGQALARLPALLRENPKLVIISIGGNDFLQRQPESATRENIGKMIEMVQAANIPVVLVAVPRPTVGALLGIPSDHPLYEDLAEQYKVPLLKGVWAEILGDGRLKSDAVHANAEGYRRFAEEMADFLRKQGII